MSGIDEMSSGLLVALGLSADLLTVPGVSVVATDDRAGSGVAAAYLLGEHLVLWCDPAVAARVSGFDLGTAGTALDQWAEFAPTAGGAVLGGGVLRVLPEGVVFEDPGAVVALDGDVAAHRARVADLVGRCPPDDVDEAEVDPERLDPVVRCTEASPGGPLTAFGSALPWNRLSQYWDIGVLTVPADRRQGLGKRCVIAVTAALQENGHAPLYRHDADNETSARLAESLGFEVAAKLTAVSFGIES